MSTPDYKEFLEQSRREVERLFDRYLGVTGLPRENAMLSERHLDLPPHSRKRDRVYTEYLDALSQADGLVDRVYMHAIVVGIIMGRGLEAHVKQIIDGVFESFQEQEPRNPNPVTRDQATNDRRRYNDALLEHTIKYILTWKTPT